MHISLRSRSVRFGIAAAALGLVAGSAAAVSAAVGAGGGAALDGGEGPSGAMISEQLTGYEEAPLALSTSGRGTFRATITDAGIEYRLDYSGLSAAVTQAHIHFGAVGQVGGVSAFLCSNLGNGPAGTQACPAAPAEVTGTIGPADVIGPTGQGIAAGEYAELVDAIRSGAAYVNVHSALFPVGEIRGQIERGAHH